MKNITWKSLLKTFSDNFEKEIQKRLDILNELNKRSGRPKYTANMYGTAYQRKQMVDSGQADEFLNQLDQQILNRQKELNRTIINPTPTLVRSRVNTV